MEMKLEHPIEFAQRSISTLTFREAKAKEMRGIKGDMTFGDLLDIGGSLCAEPRTVMDKLHPVDARRVVDHVGKALGPGRLTSEELSP